MKSDYVLFRRKGKKIWYFYYYRGHKRIHKSTGKTLKKEAKQYVEDFLKKANQRKILFKDFTKDFFIWNSCQWIKKQHTYSRRFSREHAKNKRGILLNYLLPQFGDFFIHEITKADIETLLIDLDRSNQTRNHILYTFRQIMREAEDQGIIEYSIAERVQSFSVKHEKTDIFTLKELKILFPGDEREILRIWWDYKHAALFIILASTGIRSGEVRALHWKDYLAKEKALFIHRAVKDDQGTIGDTKTGNERVVLLSKKACMYIEKWVLIANRKNLMFPGEEGKPYTRFALNHSLHMACKRAGIKKGDRVVKSFRHTFNTIHKDILPGYLLRLLTGHRTDKMTQHYYNPVIDDLLKRLEPAREIVDKLF